MRKLHLLMATLFTVFATSSGVVQTQAAVFNYQVDFLDKEVADFNDFKPLFYVDTYDLKAKIEWNWFALYYWDQPGKTMNVDWTVNYRINGSGSFIVLKVETLPNIASGTSPQTYNAQVIVDLPSSVIEAIMSDDTNFVEFRSRITYRTSPDNYNSILYFEQMTQYFNLFYEFNTTYLFNYFLSDQRFVSQDYPTNYTVGMPQAHFLEYVYTTAGNDTYLVENSLQASIGTTRKKYAIDVPDVYFRGESVGAQFRSTWDGTGTGVDIITQGSSNSFGFQNKVYRYHFLNVANNQQAQVTVPQIAFTTEVCSGGFLDINVGCFFNNAMAWLVNDAPVVSSAFTLLNAGIVMAGQTFGIIGSFTQNNMFGVLILAGFGFIAVRWLIKND
jgi:hypothetical protein